MGRDIDIKVTGRHFQPYHVRGRLGALQVNSELIHSKVRVSGRYGVRVTLPTFITGDSTRSLLLRGVQINDANVMASLADKMAAMGHSSGRHDQFITWVACAKPCRVMTCV